MDSEQTEVDIKKLIGQLEASDPDGVSFIRIVCINPSDGSSGDSDPSADSEYVLEGNQRGINLLAAALLRVAHFEDPDSSYPEIDELLFDLFDKQTDIYLSDITRTDDADFHGENRTATIGERLGSIGCVAFLISIPVLWLVGAYTIYLWLTD